MDIKKYIQSVLIISIIGLIPFISNGQSSKVDDYKYSISAGINYGVFLNPIWNPENYYVSPPSQSWEHLADSIKLNGLFSPQFIIKYKVFSNKMFSASLGLGITTEKYHGQYFHSDSIIATNIYLPKEKTIELYYLNIPISINYQHNKFCISTGIYYTPIMYRYMNKNMQNNMIHTTLNLEKSLLLFYPFISTSYLMVDDKIQILPKIGVYYNKRTYTGLLELNFALQFRF